MIDHGAFRLTYSRTDGKIELEPSEVRWGTSRIKLAGNAERRDATGRWDYRVFTNEIALGAEEFGLPAIPLDRLISQGTYDPKSRALDIDRFYMQAADAQINLAGSIRHGEESPAIQMTGWISAMPIAFFKLIWPKFVAPGARDWIGNHVPTGKIAGGSVRSIFRRPPRGRTARRRDPQSALDFPHGPRKHAGPLWGELSPFQAAKATATVSGHRFFFVVPESMFRSPPATRSHCRTASSSSAICGRASPMRKSTSRPKATPRQRWNGSTTIR